MGHVQGKRKQKVSLWGKRTNTKGWFWLKKDRRNFISSFDDDDDGGGKRIGLVGSLLWGWVLDKVDALLDVALEALGAGFEKLLLLLRDAAEDVLGLFSAGCLCHIAMLSVCAIFINMGMAFGLGYIRRVLQGWRRSPSLLGS